MALRHKAGLKLPGKSLVRPSSCTEPPPAPCWVDLGGRQWQMGELLGHRLACWKLQDPAGGGGAKKSNWAIIPF